MKLFSLIPYCGHSIIQDCLSKEVHRLHKSICRVNYHILPLDYLSVPKFLILMYFQL